MIGTPARVAALVAGWTAVVAGACVREVLRTERRWGVTDRGAAAARPASTKAGRLVTASTAPQRGGRLTGVTALCTDRIVRIASPVARGAGSISMTVLPPACAAGGAEAGLGSTELGAATGVGVGVGVGVGPCPAIGPPPLGGPGPCGMVV